MAIHSELNGNIIFTNHIISGSIDNTNYIIEGNVQGEAMRSAPDYEGLYEFTPDADVHIIPVYGYRMIQDIIINPIPSNYGKIEWDGSAIKVS